jgi:hypothetical protein
MVMRALMMFEGKELGWKIRGQGFKLFTLNKYTGG